MKVAAEVTYPVRFYVVLSAVVIGISGLWYSALPIDGPYLPPSPRCRAMLEQAIRQGEQCETSSNDEM